ncbi:MAG: hypothetical protein J6K39_03485 [Clostridia bacterium]|nr:hypothetical protein [Clostridia bacterium]
MKIWNDEEVKFLFSAVEDCKNEQKSLKNAFILHAEKFKRKPNSVRNYYYHEVDNLCEDKARCVKLGIDIFQHSKTHFVSFDKIQEEELFEKIENFVKAGESVRAACLKLSGGDLSLMTRFQNKYQNMKRKIERENKIIPFQKPRKGLTDSDINSLFLGLVKLIKKAAQEEAADKNSSEVMQKAYADLCKKDEEIAFLKSEFEKIKNENKNLLLKLEKSKKNALEYHIIKKRTTDGDENQKRV